MALGFWEFVRKSLSKPGLFKVPTVTSAPTEVRMLALAGLNFLRGGLVYITSQHRLVAKSDTEWLPNHFTCHLSAAQYTWKRQMTTQKPMGLAHRGHFLPDHHMHGFVISKQHSSWKRAEQKPTERKKLSFFRCKLGYWDGYWGVGYLTVHATTERCGPCRTGFALGSKLLLVYALIQLLISLHLSGLSLMA